VFHSSLGSEIHKLLDTSSGISL